MIGVVGLNASGACVCVCACNRNSNSFTQPLAIAHLATETATKHTHALTATGRHEFRHVTISRARGRRWADIVPGPGHRSGGLIGG